MRRFHIVQDSGVIQHVHTCADSGNQSTALLQIPQKDFHLCGVDPGNIIYVNRRSNLVVAITSRFQPRVTDRIELIRKYVTPVFAGNGIDIAEA